MNRNTAVAIAAGAALLTGIGAYMIWDRNQAREAAATPEAPVSVARLAETLPVFTLLDREGQPKTLADWSGRSLIVNFWATWCAPCRREIPLLQRLQREYGDEGFQVIGVAVDFRDSVLAYANDMKIDYPLLIGEQDGLDAATAFGVDAIGFPFTVFSDRKGRIVAAHMGELTPDQADVILAAIRRVDTGTDTLEQARKAIEQGLAALPAVPEASGG
jgi:thiol-disulfide isomerase/thioredoxin